VLREASVAWRAADGDDDGSRGARGVQGVYTKSHDVQMGVRKTPETRL